MPHQAVHRPTRNVMTPAVENILLERLASNRAAATEAQLIAQTAAAIWFNQQEDVSSDAVRLSKAEVEQIVRERWMDLST